MDALSDALSALRTRGAIFSSVECSSPWGFSVPSMAAVASGSPARCDRLVNYHLVTEGQASVRLPGAPVLVVGPGDIVVLPHGDAHVVSNGSPTNVVDSTPPDGDVLASPPRTIRFGGGGTITRIICGFFACEPHADRLFLAGLPRVFKVNVRGDAAGAWLERTVHHLVGEAETPRPGTAILLARMAEALFVETLRRYMNEMPDDQAGWLAGARDPIVGRALALLHREPQRTWSITTLAAEVAVSRSVLGERFARFVGEPPLAYLARWRLQLAARYLESSDRGVSEIAMDVGYHSEPAFNRAFKRQFGIPPARYRKTIRPT
jgi:AraC-like DNA-binding protein